MVGRDSSQKTHPTSKDLGGGEIKRVANAREPPVVIPVVVVAVDVELALVVPPVERGEFVRSAFCATAHRVLSGLYRVWHL